MNQTLSSLQSIDRTQIRFRGRRLTFFGGCDYFRMASHPRVLRAAQSAMKQYGLNVAASRYTTGNHKLYDQLEAILSTAFQSAGVLLVANGYSTNLVVAQTLAKSFTHILIDEKAHPSLKDAADIFRGPKHSFRHRDPDDVRRQVARLPAEARTILLTDGVFGYDGGTAPLRAYRKVMPGNSWMLVDEAHAAGVLGENGRGTFELEGIRPVRGIRTLTLSKAFGAYGGAILGSRLFCNQATVASRLLAGSTPFPLPMAAAAIRSVQIVMSQSSARQRLQKSVRLVRESLRQAGHHLPDYPSPVITLYPDSGKSARRWEKRLLTNNIHPPWIRYPGGPARGFFRFAISCRHSQEQLLHLIRALS